MIQRNFKKALNIGRAFSAQPSPEPINHYFKTTESNPKNHCASHVGQFYTVSPETHKTLFTYGGLPLAFTKQVKTFTETCIMVREPALDIISLIEQSDMSKPVNRFLLYGENGTGKSLTLAHLLHYALVENYLIFHVPWVPEWLRRTTRSKEMSNSTTREGFVDLPLDAAAWLIHFKKQNQKILKETNLPVSKEYTWSKREITPMGSPLQELIEFGINRYKFASDIVVAVAEEIKILSQKKICKVFVAIDGFNSFYYPKTRLKTVTKRVVAPNEVTLSLSCFELTKNDWCNGVVVVTADQIAVPEDHHESYYPRYLLGKEGFEHMDPFIPIAVNRYSDKEFYSCTSYYRDRLWLRGYPDAEKQLAFTSAKNPYQLMVQCAPL